jgi:hypothetical protein
MPKVLSALSSPFSLLAPVKSFQFFKFKVQSSKFDVRRPSPQIQVSQTQSSPVKPNPTTLPPPGKETACPPECFRRRRVNALQALPIYRDGCARDERAPTKPRTSTILLRSDPLVPLVEHQICADIVTIRNFRLLNKRAGQRSKLRRSTGRRL